MFIISEISPQFSGDINMAKRMINFSYLCGASAVKLQLYPANMFSSDNLDRGYLELSYNSFVDLCDYGDKIGIDVFATAFTEETLEWCIKLKRKYLKIPARMHKENPDLIKKILNKKIKTFISIPYDKEKSKFDELNYIKDENLIFLSCISDYPTLLSDVEIPDFKNTIFEGISDHSVGISAAIKASCYGANYLEKHFTLEKNYQKHTEKGHLGGMDIDDLMMIKKLTTEIEMIGKKPQKIKT
jgi:N-acetylneuraminate synthase